MFWIGVPDRHQLWRRSRSHTAFDTAVLRLRTTCASSSTTRHHLSPKSARCRDPLACSTRTVSYVVTTTSYPASFAAEVSRLAPWWTQTAVRPPRGSFDRTSAAHCSHNTSGQTTRVPSAARPSARIPPTGASASDGGCAAQRASTCTVFPIPCSSASRPPNTSSCAPDEEEDDDDDEAAVAVARSRRSIHASAACWYG